MRSAVGVPWLYPPFPASCPFRSTVAGPLLSPLTDPTVQDYRSGFLKRDSPSYSKRGRSEVATTGVSVGLLQISPTSSRFHECDG